MAVQKIKTVFQFRRATAEEWLLNKDVKPAAGEPCFVTDKNILKIGDGVTTFENLEPINGVNIATDGKSLVLEDGVFKLAGFDANRVGAQPRISADGGLEWVMVPTVETVSALQDAVATLQNDVAGLKTNVGTLQGDIADLRAIVGSSETGSDTLLSRVEGLEKEVDTIMHGLTPDDGKIDSLIELINYVDTHGKAAEKIVSDITTLQDLVGLVPVANQISDAIEASEKKSNNLYKHVKYEISHKPDGALVDYRDKEIRVMVPDDTQWVKQTVGGTGNANMYYMGFKAYAPEGAVGFKEGDRGVIIDEMFDFNGDFAGTDEYGRNFSICWLALASYDENSDTWTYFGKNSNVNKYIGWTYCVEWYDANGKVIESDCIRINLSNEACHNVIEPYYMASVVKGVSVNGTLLDAIEGVVDIAVPEYKSSDEIAVDEDGTLSIKSISFDKIAQGEYDYLVMDGGSAV